MPKTEKCDGEGYGYLGHFRKERYLNQGHNDEPRNCRSECSSAVDVRKCMDECRGRATPSTAEAPSLVPKGGLTRSQALQKCMDECEGKPAVSKRICMTRCAADM